jgi:ABC-type phosphate transport system substrate-binding protein
MIRAGKIISGSVDKAVIGKSQGGLIHILFNDFGSGTTKVFLNQVQKVSNYWIKQTWIYSWSWRCCSKCRNYSKIS